MPAGPSDREPNDRIIDFNTQNNIFPDFGMLPGIEQLKRTDPSVWIILLG